MSCPRFEGVARWGRASQSSVKRFANIFGASSNTFCGADELQNSSAWARQGEACSVWHTLQRDNESERETESVCVVWQTSVIYQNVTLFAPSHVLTALYFIVIRCPCPEEYVALPHTKTSILESKWIQSGSSSWLLLAELQTGTGTETVCLPLAFKVLS